MTPSRSADLARLRAANPEPIDATRVRGAAAQATLARILSEPVEHPGTQEPVSRPLPGQLVAAR